MLNKIFVSLLFVGLLSFSVMAQHKGANKVRKPPKKRKVVKIVKFKNPDTMFRLLAGKWIFSDMNCENPYFVEVAKDRKTITFTTALTKEEKEEGAEGETRNFIYDVLKVGDYFIETQIQDEKRMTEDGKPVKWNFLFVSANEFRWQRTDLKPAGLSSAVTRCIEKN